MKKCLIMFHSDKTPFSNKLISLLIDILKEAEIKTIDCRLPQQNQYYFDAITEFQPELLITFDFAGFFMQTDTKEISYTILPCKSLHFILHENKKDFARYLSKKLSIAMFFYCQGPDIFKSLQEAYPEIPYLKEIEVLKLESQRETDHYANKLILKAAVEDMKKESLL